MKPHLFYFLSILIALTSLSYERPMVEFTVDEISALSAIPAWDLNPIQTDEKLTHKHIHIAQGFRPIVLLADFNEYTPRFSYYLPIHDLIRPKEYFLLI